MIRILRRGVALSGWLLSGVPTIGFAQIDEPATGFALWVRAPGRSIQDLASSAVAAPQFAIGVRRSRFGLGLGIGLSMVRASDKDTVGGQTLENEISATAFQLGPSGFLDIWHSADHRVRGQIAAGIGIGRLSVTETDQFLDFSGNVQTTETKTTGTMLGFHAALAGEYSLHPHFALGVEGGLQGTFALDVEQEGTGTSLGLGASGAYGALRVMVVF